MRLIDADKLDEDISNGSGTDLQKLFAACCVATAPTVNPYEWISVEERLPETKINCIVHYKHTYCDDDGYYAIGTSFYDGNDFQIGLAYKVTYWMPLPEPPTNGGE